MNVLLLAALSSGQTALDCLAERGFPTVLVTHADTSASDFVDLGRHAGELGIQTILYGTAGSLAILTSPNRPFVPLYPIAPDLTYLQHILSDLKFKPDIGLCIGWSKLLDKEWLSLPRIGWLGMHESLLPKNRGRAPIPWTLLHDRRFGGVSFFWLTEGVDDGDLFCQAPFPIGPRDTSADLLAKANTVTRDLLLNDVLPNLKAGNFKRTPQNHAEATYCPRRAPDMGYLDFSRSADELDRLIRAVTRPYPGAFCWHKLRRIAVWSGRPVVRSEYSYDLATAHYGTIVWVSDDGTKQWVVTGSGLLEIYLPAGRMQVGDRFDGSQYYEP